MICVHECGLSERVEKIRSVTHMLEPNLALMRDNPWSKIPTLITDSGLVLMDSDVICEYLDSLQGAPRLHPSDPAQRWPALRWRAFGSEMLDVLILWRNERARSSAQQLPMLLEAFALKMRMGLAMLERQVDELAGAPLHIGHVAIGCALGYLDFRFADLEWRSAQPRLALWQAQFKLRPAVRATEPDDDTPRAAAPTARPEAGSG